MDPRDRRSVFRIPNNVHEVIQLQETANPRFNPDASITAFCGVDESRPDLSPPMAVCYQSVTSAPRYQHLSFEELRLSEYNLHQNIKRRELFFACTRIVDVDIAERPRVKLPPPDKGMIDACMERHVRALLTTHPTAKAIFQDKLNLALASGLRKVKADIENDFERQVSYMVVELRKEATTFFLKTKDAMEQDYLQHLSHEQAPNGDLQAKHELLYASLKTLFTVRNVIRTHQCSDYRTDANGKRFWELLDNIDSLSYTGLTYLLLHDQLLGETDRTNKNTGPSSLPAIPDNTSVQRPVSATAVTPSVPSNPSAPPLPQRDARNSATLHKTLGSPQPESEKEDQELEETGNCLRVPEPMDEDEDGEECEDGDEEYEDEEEESEEGERRGEKRERSLSPVRRILRPRRRL